MNLLGSAHSHPLGFVSAARMGRTPRLGEAACSYTGKRICISSAARPVLQHANSRRTERSIIQLMALSPESKEEDDWNSYAMLEDSEDSSEDDEVAESQAVFATPATASTGFKKVAPEDDPRAVHVPAIDDDASILQSSGFGQVSKKTEL